MQYLIARSCPGCPEARTAEEFYDAVRAPVQKLLGAWAATARASENE